MKVLATALLLALLATVPAVAEEASLTACTKDQKQVTLVIEWLDDVSANVKVHVTMVFKQVAQAMSAMELQGHKGFEAFQNALTEEDKNSFDYTGPPEINGVCKVT